jgi:hypothetical protein
VLDIVVHKNVRLSDVIVSDILDSDHLPFVSHLFDHVKTGNISDPFDKHKDWERFQSLASDLISPRIQISLGESADKAAQELYSLYSFGVYAIDKPSYTLVHK